MNSIKINKQTDSIWLDMNSICSSPAFGTEPIISLSCLCHAYSLRQPMASLCLSFPSGHGSHMVHVDLCTNRLGSDNSTHQSRPHNPFLQHRTNRKTEGGHRKHDVTNQTTEHKQPMTMRLPAQWHMPPTYTYKHTHILYIHAYIYTQTAHKITYNTHKIINVHKWHDDHWP